MKYCVSIEEMEKISKHLKFSDLQVAVNLFNKLNEYYDCTNYALVGLLYAGYISGVRAERKKRNRK